VALFATRFYVAFDSSAVDAAAVVSGIVDGPRTQAFARTELGPGALLPSPTAANLVRGDEVRAALRRSLTGLGRDVARATLVLPDGVARIALVELPAGADGPGFVRYRFAASLPWAASEGVVDALPVGRARVVGAAVRRATVAEYEQAAADAGLQVERVHLAPLVALDGLLRLGPRDAVHVVLGDTAVCLAAFRGGALLALRNRRRDPTSGEARRLVEEAARTALVAGDGSPSVLLCGTHALRLRRELGHMVPAERTLEGPQEWPEAIEAAWLGGVLA
jgi:hypothetical protein